MSDAPNTAKTTESKGLGDHVNGVKDLVVAYTKQETVQPLKSLGQYLKFGAPGAILIGFGLVFLLLALLRGLQQVDMFNAAVEGMRWSWVPYLVTFLVGAIMMALVGKGALREWNNKGRRPADR